MSADTGDIHQLLIIGAGVAGLTAARRAQQLGVRPVILEKHEGEGPGVGNGRLSGGWFHAGMCNPVLHEPEALYERLIEITDGVTRRDLARAWAENVRRTLDFLRAEGGDFQVLNEADEGMHNVLMPQREASIGQPWQSRGPDLLLSAMLKRFLAQEGLYLPGHRARRLEVSDGAVVGVHADTPHGEMLIRAHRILIADGGFQGNDSLVRRYITSGYKLRGSRADTGDGLLMAEEIGAKLINMNWFYGHPLCRDALRDDRLWPYPGPNALINAGVMVDGRGRRFVDEGVGGERLANAIAQSDTPLACWAVFDAEAWEREGRLGDVPINPVLEASGGQVLRADSIEALAQAVDLPVDALAASVEAVNRFASNGVAADPIRSGPVRPLATKPYMAVGVVAGVTFAMGGLLVNKDSQVLDGDEKPLPNLYAAGGAMGGLQGGPNIGVAGGWSEASTFGLLAAEHAAASLLAS